MSFWKKDKFWIGLIALIGVGAFIYFFFFSEQKIIIEVAEEKEEVVVEESRGLPYSQIQSPPTNYWYGNDFIIRVLDEELEIGIKENSCQYRVVAFGPEGKEFASGWRRRECNSTQLITVGPEGDCMYEGRESCSVYVRSQSLRGNWYIPSQEDSSIRTYDIDFSSPSINQSEIKKKDNNSFAFELKAEDNFQLQGCLLYVEGEKQGVMELVDPECKNNCWFEKDFDLTSYGDSSAYAYCRDSAGNWGRGETLSTNVNIPPVIEYCKTSSSTGNKETIINFEVKAYDIDEDELFFNWDFDDGNFSEEENTSHQYLKKGLYRPSIQVSDGINEVECLTPWILIEE